MRLRVVYYAALREQRGLSEESVETSAATPAALYDELRARHQLRLAPEILRAAVNDAFAAWETPLSAGDTVVFIPPVAGG